MSNASDALRLKAILDSAVTAIITIDDKGRIQSASAAVTRIFGYSEDDVVGRNVSMLMHGPDASQHDGHLARYLATGERRIIGIGREVVARHRDGHDIPVHLSVGEFELDGRRYFTGIIADLSRQRRAEARLAHEEALLRSIFDSLADALIVTDRDWNVRLVNASFTRMLGFMPDEIVGRSMTTLCAGGELHGSDPAITLCPNGEPTPAPVLLTFTRKGGAAFPGETVCAPIRSHDGHGHGFVALVRDVARELKRETAMRTIARLEAIGQLTGGIAHDFNNLLTIIVGNLELLASRITRPSELSLLREVLDAAEKGAELTDRLLSFARRRRLDTQTVALDELVAGMAGLLRRTLGANIALEVDCAQDLWPTRSDPGLIETAVINLVINARDAMPGGGLITISLRNAALDNGAASLSPGLAPGRYVALAVTDTGLGMTPEVIERAFEPFFTTKEPGKGSGLGLASVYGFARQSGGHATIYSEPGKGTTVTLYLPQAERPAASPAVELEDQGAPRGAGRLVLVVEDDANVRRLTLLRLEELDYRVVAASNADEALALIAAGIHPDAVLTDFMMPGTMNGLELAKKLTAEHPGIAVVLSTGYAKGLVDEDELARQGLSVLRKPYRQSDLARVLRASLAHNGRFKADGGE